MLLFYLLAASLIVVSSGKHVVSKRQADTNILKVVTIETEPYLMKKGNGEYEGYIPDLMDKVAQVVDFSYEVYLVEDGRYGSRRDDGRWDGMIGDLAEKKADIAAAPLTISSVRERMVDFTKPFMSSGITTLFSKSSSSGGSSHMRLFQLFTVEVWIVIVVVAVVCIVLMYLLNRFIPKTKDGDEDSGCAGETRSLCAAVARLSCINKSQPASVTVLLITWTVFVVLTGALYFSKLMAFLAVEPITPMPPPYTSLAELADSSLDFGYISGGSTYQFFWTSKIPVYEKINDRATRVETTEEGIQKVQAGNYVLIGESATLDYAANTHCDLMTVGNPINSVGYGLATPLGSELRERLNLAILELRENGILQKLERKWWHDRSLCGKDTSYTGASDSGSDSVKRGHPVTLDDFGRFGSLILLVIGLVITLVVAAIEKLLARK